MEGFRVEGGRLTISKVERNAGGDYMCKVSNPAGTDQATVKVEVQGKLDICINTHTLNYILVLGS